MTSGAESWSPWHVDRFLSCTFDFYACVPLFVSQLFLSSAPRYSAGLSDSPWEAKAIAVIQAIRDKEVITNQSINQSINQSTNQPINQSTNQSINHQPIINQSISESVNQLISQSISQSINLSVSWSIDQSINSCLSQLIDLSACPSIHRSFYLPRKFLF